MSDAITPRIEAIPAPALSAARHEVSWRWVLPHLCVDLAIGTLFFMLICTVAVGLHHFVHWMEVNKLPHMAIVGAASTKWLLFGSDLILFVIYVVRTTWHHAKLTWTQEIR